VPNMLSGEGLGAKIMRIIYNVNCILHIKNVILQIMYCAVNCVEINQLKGTSLCYVNSFSF
jgi:hypothetical protein